MYSTVHIFKIKQIQLGYNLPKNLLKQVGLSNLRLYCSLDDFFTFTKYPGFDPEFTSTGNAMGLDMGSYPSSKKVVLGLNVVFLIFNSIRNMKAKIYFIKSVTCRLHFLFLL